MGPDVWKQFSKDYDNKVYSLTKVPQHRKEICDQLTLGFTLNVGTGSAHYMNQHLLIEGHTVIATDFCQDMLTEAENNFTDPNLEYKLADTRDLPFYDSIFDNVISMNSILPENRFEVSKMFSSIHRVLKPKGTFAAFLPSFDCGQSLSQEWGIKLDEEEMREYDTTGWQCFHTPQSIKNEMGYQDWKKLKVYKVLLDAPEDITQLEDLYGVDTTYNPIWEYLVVAKKK